MSADKPVLLGLIVGAHGLRGEVRLKSFTSVAEDIAAYGALSDESTQRHFTFVSVKPAKECLIARIEGVSDRNQAEALKGTKLYVPRDRLPVPDEDDFYHQDLIGLGASDSHGRSYGQVLSVQNFGAGDLLEIGDASLSEFLPFTRAFVPKVDLAARQIVIAPPDDFLKSDTKAKP